MGYCKRGVYIEEILCETELIDYSNPLVQEKVNNLRAESINYIDYINRSFLFVRDEISHSWDVQKTIVSKMASDVLKNKTGICWIVKGI